VSNRVIGAIVLGIGMVLFVIYMAGLGAFGTATSGGEPSARAVDAEVVAVRAEAQREAALGVGVARPKQILFGDLHVHSTFSFDAFTMSLPMAGGDGAHPVADACDFARHCSALDFWSITDHAITLTPREWGETIDTIRQCNAVAENPASPDTVAYLGWEWTQVGATPETHWGHKNVILRDLDDDAIPARPIAAAAPLGDEDARRLVPSPFALGLFALGRYSAGGSDLAHFLRETAGVPDCPEGVDERDLPTDCRESARTPADQLQ